MKKKLTPRQQKLFEMLLNGIPPKEIASNLDIAYNTLLFHQKELYRKLGVHSIEELIIKFAPDAKNYAANIIEPEFEVIAQEDFAAGGWLDKRSGEVGYKKTLPVRRRVFFGILLFAVVLLFILFFTRKPTDEGFPAVFNRWSTFTEKAGSSINVTVNTNDVIGGKHFTSYTMSGVLSGGEGWHFAGMTLHPTPLTHQAMKRMTSFSFKVLGDGRPYMVFIPTTDTQLDNEYTDHYRIMFSTTKGRISTIIIDVDDLMQSGYGKQVPFVRDNIIGMEFFIDQNFTLDSFNLKVWDIRIY